MSRGFLRRGIRATARLVGVKRRKHARLSHPDTPERARARLFSPLDRDAVEADVVDDDDRALDDDGDHDLAGSQVLPPMGPPTSVVGIVGAQVREALSARGDVPDIRDVLPGDERSILESLDAHTLVLLDRAALADGPWAGVEAATGTRLMAALLPLLDEVRAQGGQVVLLDHLRPRNVNTNLLVERSDIVLPDTAESDDALGEQPRSGLMTVLQQVASSQTRTRAEEARS